MVPLSFNSSSGTNLGLKVDDHVLDVTSSCSELGLEPLTPQPLLALGTPALDTVSRVRDRLDELGHYIHPETDLRLTAPVQSPSKILCVGLNYRKHAAESGMSEPKHPILFSKFANTIVGPDAEVSIGGLEHVDYEAELAFVIGRRGKHIQEEEALSYVLAYFNANDLSERALQSLSGQWLLGKTLDGFLPIGPYLVTADEVGNPQSLHIRGWLDAELRQDSSTADMIFSVAETIAYASRYMTLEPGDVVCTGTPEGVVLGRNPKVWMQPGDSYTVEVEGLGRLRTTFVS